MTAASKATAFRVTPTHLVLFFTVQRSPLVHGDHVRLAGRVRPPTQAEAAASRRRGGAPPPPPLLDRDPAVDLRQRSRRLLDDDAPRKPQQLKTGRGIVHPFEYIAVRTAEVYGQEPPSSRQQPKPPLRISGAVARLRRGDRGDRGVLFVRAGVARRWICSVEGNKRSKSGLPLLS